MLDITITGRGKRIFQAMQKADTQGVRAIESGIKNGFEVLGKRLQRAGQKAILNGPKTGIIYKRSGGRTHQASAPGEAPANDTGNLLKSVEYKARSTELVWGYTAKYGRFLELGTRKMKKRPNIIKRSVESQKEAKADFEKTIGRALKQWLS